MRSDIFNHWASLAGEMKIVKSDQYQEPERYVKWTIFQVKKTSENNWPGEHFFQSYSGFYFKAAPIPRL